MKDTKDKFKLIGIIDLSTEELINEDCTGRINFSNKIGECQVYVYSNEGIIPHFHLIAKDGNESCICIYEPLYFNHGRKTMRLNSKQRKELDNWLNEPNIDNEAMSNWESINAAWKLGNGYDNVPKDPAKPNYRYMENMRS